MSDAESWRVILGRVERWAAHYHGPPFHALLCDPPYHLVSIVKRFARTARTEVTVGTGPYGRHAAGFMGQTWDGGDVSFRPETWAALGDHLLPGAFGMAFGAARGWHRLAVAIEDAGFIIHPSIFGWLYGEGFPKGTRVDTAIDRAAGAERQRGEMGRGTGYTRANVDQGAQQRLTTEFSAPGDPVTDLAKAWVGHRYGLQALKPALEPIIVFQKPYEGQPVDDITRTGAGTLNIDAARIESAQGDGIWGTSNESVAADRPFNRSPDRAAYRTSKHPRGRWPANFALTHLPGCERVGTREVRTNVATSGESQPQQLFGYGNQRGKEPRGYGDADGLEEIGEWRCEPGCPVAALNDQAGERHAGTLTAEQQERGGFAGAGGGQIYGTAKHGGSNEYAREDGPASRYFFQADWNSETEEAFAEDLGVLYETKAGVTEREEGLRFLFPCYRCHSYDSLSHKEIVKVNGEDREIEVRCRRNTHPAIKPISLARWMATLLLPPEAYAPRRILIPFSGVGSEMVAALQAGWECAVGVEAKPEYRALSLARLRWWTGRIQFGLWE